MSGKSHRGPHPEDARLFATDSLPDLRAGVADLSWLLSRGYAERGALKLVGDRYALVQRQRTGVMRAACSDASREARRAREVPVKELDGATLVLDAFNVLITVEAALAGGVVLVGRDGAYRDMASVHGSYRTVPTTERAVGLIGEALGRLGVARARWIVERPVSNSGRLAGLLRKIAGGRGWAWEVELEERPDALLRTASEIVASADGPLIESCARWTGLARHVVTGIDGAWVVDLGAETTPSSGAGGAR